MVHNASIRKLSLNKWLKCGILKVRRCHFIWKFPLHGRMTDTDSIGWEVVETFIGSSWIQPYKSCQHSPYDDRKSNCCANLLANHASVGSTAREPLDAHIYSRYGKWNGNRKLDKEWISLDSTYPVSNQNRYLALVWHFAEKCSILQFCLGADL
jgi:hypothetical protein